MSVRDDARDDRDDDHEDGIAADALADAYHESDEYEEKIREAAMDLGLLPRKPKRTRPSPRDAGAASDKLFIDELERAKRGETEPIASAADLARRAGRNPATFHRALRRNRPTSALARLWDEAQRRLLLMQAEGESRLARGDLEAEEYAASTRNAKKRRKRRRHT